MKLISYLCNPKLKYCEEYDYNDHHYYSGNARHYEC